MTITTPGIAPASRLLQSGRPAWLDVWGAFAAELRFDDLPGEVVSRAKLVLLDCIGAIATGAQEPECRALAARLAAQAEAALGNEAARGLARRVVVHEDPALTAQLPGLRPARVAVTLTDGRVLRAEALTNRGDTEDPYSAAEVRLKFHELAGPVWGDDHAGRIAETVDWLDGTDLRALLSLVAAAAHQPRTPT